MTTIQMPESNADNVALNLVYDAIVDDTQKPGDAIAELLEKMAGMAREIGRVNRFTNAEWRNMVAEFGTESDIKSVVDGHLEAAGDMWAQEWMLCNMAKHLHDQLERNCLDFPFAEKIESIKYERSGKVESWTQRNEQ